MIPFDFLEDQFIRSSMSTKTDDEIALLLERSVEEIVQRMNELTNGAAAERNRDVELQREEDAKARKSKTARKDFQKQSKEREEKRQEEHRKLKNVEEANRVRRQRQEQKRSCKTVQRDWSDYRPVRVNHKTLVYIKNGEDPKKAIELYKLNESIRNRNTTLKED